MDGTINISRPQVRVTFYPQNSLTLGTPITISVNIDTRDDLIQVQTQKDSRSPAGQFTLVLAPKPVASYDARGKQGRDASYRNILRPGDMVVIEMGPDRPQPDSAYQQIVTAQGYSGLEPVMIGSIDDIRETTTFSATDGKPERTLVITGRDFGKYLVDDQVWWDSWSQPAQALYGLSPEIDEWLRAKKTQGKAAGMVELLLKWMEQHFDISFLFHTTKNKNAKFLFRDLLRYKLTTDSPVIAAPLSLESYQGAPWSLMERVASLPLYVLTFDTRRRMDTNILLDSSGSGTIDNNNQFFFNSKNGNWDSQPTLLLYRNPWSNREYDDWLNLPTRVIQDDDIIARDIGRSNEEISNTWRVWTDAQGVFRTQGGGDIGDARALRDYDSIQRYGERPLIITTPFVSGLGGGDQKDTVKRFSFMLKDWNRWNEWFLNGRFQFKGMAAVKVGDRLWHWDPDYGEVKGNGFSGGVDYYVQSVTQEFRCFVGWTTTCMVTRGQQHRERGHLLDYDDVPLTEADLANTQSPNRKKMQDQTKKLRVWGDRS